MQNEEREEDACRSVSPDVLSVAVNVNSDQHDRHRLKTPWTFWLHKASRGVSVSQYEASVRHIYTVSGADAFWAVLANLPHVRHLSARYSYHLMPHTRRPVWEQPEHVRGGTWRIKCAKQHSWVVWKEVLLACVHEQFASCIGPEDEICGASISVREREDVVQLWNADADSVSERVPDMLRFLLPAMHFTALFYKRHETHRAFDGSRY